MPVGGGGAWPGFETAHHHTAPQAPLVWRAPEGPEGTGGLRGAAPNEVRPPSLAGGRAIRRPEHPWDHKARPIGGRRGACGAWPGFEPTRRAKLAARTASGRAGHAAAGDLSGPQARVWRSRGRPGPTAPGTPAEPQATSSTANSGCAAGEEGAGGSGGRKRPGCGARGRWRGLAGQRADAPSEARCADGSRAGRRPRAHQAARPIKAGRAAAGDLSGLQAPKSQNSS